MLVPNAHQAIVPPEKITHYLLSLTSKQGKDKALFFMAFGFSLDHWEVLAEALKTHIMSHEVSSIRETPYGLHYVVEGLLLSPDQRNPSIRSVWKIENTMTEPSFVTAYPL